MLENESRDIYSSIAIAHILELQANHQVILDDQFLATCLNIHAIRVLHNLIIEIHGLLHYRGNKLVERLHHNGSSGLAGITDFMLLQIINRAEPLFEHLINQKNLHPEQLYQILLQLNGELSTLTNTSRRPITGLVYQHDKLQGTFEPVQKKLRKALSIVLEETAVAIPLEERQNSTWIALIDDKTLLQKASFVLAVHAQLSQEELKQSVLTQVKLSPTEEIRILVNRALPGIELQPLAVAPRQIPHHAHYVYFALNQQGTLWKQATKSTSLAIHIGGLFPGLKLEFWAIRG
jgi:type VI secretion system protein ImpJ